MNDKIKINLQLADYTFPLTINAEDESLVRQAGKEVNLRFGKYKEVYKGVPLEKILVMVAYHFSLEKLQCSAQGDTCMGQLKELSNMLENYLKD